MTDTLENTDLEQANANLAIAPKGNAGLGIAVCFTLSMLVSALLLFFVQPMFAKMALPLLGGSSGVWNTAMVFFQAVLLGGYLYAHLLSKYFPFRIQVLLHGLVMASAMFILPIAIPQGWEVPQSGTPTIWLLGLFGAALGAPFFALSANAPLLQKWFSYTNHRASGDPYFLYAASNAGSLASLLSYPILVEPFIGLSNQSYIWAVGFAVLIAMILGSGTLAQRFEVKELAEKPASINASKPLTLLRRFSWVGYAILPSSLMLGVTAHLTSNVASAPFLWVLPLALYLLTFIVAFSPRPLIPFWLVEKIFPFVVAAAILLVSINLSNFFIDIVANLLCFYLITQMCHNRLAEDRPSTENLTEFYFFMSLGGVIGGAITALVAPLVFNDVYEYHLMLAASGLVAIGAFPNRRELPREIIIALGLIVAIAAMIIWANVLPEIAKKPLLVATASILITGLFLFRKLPVRLFVFLAATALLLSNIDLVISSKDQRVLFKERSFFGISKVSYEETESGPTHLFSHGNTVHNIQVRTEEALNVPLAYYSPNGAFGQTIDAVRTQVPNPSVAVIGLGAGAMACHVREAEAWKFYEIDPLIVKMARTQDLFTYVNNCAPQSPIITGDARLTLQKEKAASFDLIMIDAFSSNVIPAHLVTLEALELYRSKLKPGGTLFFHTSNRNLDVSSVILNTAKAAGLATRYISSKPAKTEKYKEQISESTAIIVGDSEAALDELLKGHPNWKTREGKEIVGVWRDDFSHVLGALLAKFND